MIKKTRIKFAIVIVLSLMSLLAALLINLNVTMDQTRDRNINETLDILVMTYNTDIPLKVTNAYEYLIVIVDEQDRIEDVIFGQEAVSKEMIETYREQVKLQNVKRGEIAEYRYLVKKYQGGSVIAFVNTQTDNIMLKTLREKSIRIALIGTLIIVLLSYYFSKFITKPLEMAVRKQRDFISDASHELKTPLSIIKINSTLLKNNPMDSEHLKEIDIQVNRMSELVNELLVLAKLENQGEKEAFQEFDISKTISRSLLQLELVAYEHDRELKYDIEENIMYKGIQKDFVTMVDALVDNAIKYSTERSDIIVAFKLSGKEKILTISNESSEMTKDECQRIFDGFYRLDSSRSAQVPGFGIGLSVVKRIVQKHGGTVSADYGEGIFTIKVVL
ncbi:HAMP domain-containing histidine kinase [Clostridia bacterium]|nr:HAMP domain-containing histidine kinase [Clostridia bacterium]